MTPARNAGPVVVALAIVAAIGVGAIFLGGEAVRVLSTLTADTAAVVVALLLGAVIVAGAVRSAGNASGPRRLRLERKADAYARALAILGNGEIPEVQTGGGDDWVQVRRDLALWASIGVLRRLAELPDAGGNQVPTGSDSGTGLDMLIRDMRQDLGQANLGLKAGQLTVLAAGRGKG